MKFECSVKLSFFFLCLISIIRLPLIGNRSEWAATSEYKCSVRSALPLIYFSQTKRPARKMKRVHSRMDLFLTLAALLLATSVSLCNGGKKK